MKPTELIKNINESIISKKYKFKTFPYKNFKKSCLIYKKGEYGIFYVIDNDGNSFVIKVINDYFINEVELPISIYIKTYASHIPNLLHFEDVYVDVNPINIPLFSNKNNKLTIPICKNNNIRDVFVDIDGTYAYYMTKACSYNLGYYLGKHGGSLSYDTFVFFTFQLLVALQTLHRLGIWHKDIKTSNILICNINKTYDNIKYKYNNKSWTLPYKDSDYRIIKLLDYGESVIVDDIITPCSDFKYEVNVSLYNVIRTMWNKVLHEKNINMYNNLMKQIKECDTSILDIMLNAEIFNSYINDGNNSEVVNLLT